MIIIFAALVSSALTQFAEASFRVDHPIEFVCLHEVQNENCWNPFTHYNAQGEGKESTSPAPNWAKFSNGKALTKDDWAKVQSSSTSYEETSFPVYSKSKGFAELRLKDGTPLQVPISKIRKITSLSELPYCQISGKKWWQSLHSSPDPKAKANLDFESAIPGNPFQGLEPIGTLVISKNAKGEICSDTNCTHSKVNVDPSLFSRGDKTTSASVTELTLGFAHFLGEMDMKIDPSSAKTSSTETLLVFERKGTSQFYLQSTIYNKPKVWVELSAEQSKAVKFGSMESFNSAKFHSYKKEFLTTARIEKVGEKWVDKQFWLQIKVFPFEICSLPDEISKDRAEKEIGTFWVPYSNTISLCPKGC